MFRTALSAPLAHLAFVTVTTTAGQTEELTLIEHANQLAILRVEDPRPDAGELTAPPTVLVAKGFASIGNGRPCRLVWGAPDDATVQVDAPITDAFKVDSLRAVLVQRRNVKDGVDDYLNGVKEELLFSADPLRSWVEDWSVKADPDHVLAICRSERKPLVMEHPWAPGVPIFVSIPEKTSLRTPLMEVYAEMALLRTYLTYDGRREVKLCTTCGLVPRESIKDLLGKHQHALTERTICRCPTAAIPAAQPATRGLELVV